MTRANTERLKHTPWFAKAGAACSIVPISRFVGPNIFALKGGGYGCLFSLTGLDEEGLTDQELESRVRQIEGALRGLPVGSCLYQYTRVRSGVELPRQKQYANQVTHTFASDRLAFLEHNAAFRRIDLHWCLTLEPSKAKAFERTPNDNAIETSRMLADLDKTATLLAGHLGSSLGLSRLGKKEVFQFFSYLFNLEDWAGQDELRGDTGVDRQIVKSPVSWHSDHVQIGKRHVQMYLVEDHMFIITKESAEAYESAGIQSVFPKPSETGPTDGLIPLPPADMKGDAPLTPKPTVSEVSSEPEQLPLGLTWSGDVPSQKWMNFYTKVLTKLGTGNELSLSVKVACKPKGGLSKQKMEEIRSALRELGLDDRLDG